jgi:hypothetical protein
MARPLHDSERCPVCRQARFSRRVEQVDLHQWTDRGLVRYPASIGLTACPDCGFRSWGEEVVAVMREALRRADEDTP